MSLAIVAFLGQFGDAIEFIFKSRESVSGGIQIGGSEMLGLFGKHLLLSGVSVVVAAAIAIPLGVYLGHYGKGEVVAINTSNVGRAIPTLVLLALFVSFVGAGFVPIMLSLALLALPPILTNAFVGVRQVDKDSVDASRGMGFTEGQVMRKVELPLALPTIFGGLRIAAVTVVATATIAPLANVQTLGEPILTPQTYGIVGQIGASILVASITLLIDFLFARLQRAVTPKGLKLAGDAPAKRPRFSLPTRRSLRAT